VAGVLFYEDLRKVILVGTSSGGMVICKAAEQTRERIGRLVFVDALALLPGEEVSKIVKRAASPEITPADDRPTRADVEQRLFADLTPELRAWAVERYTSRIRWPRWKPRWWSPRSGSTRGRRP